MDLVVIWNMNPELYHEGITSLKTWGGSNPKTNSVRLLLPGNTTSLPVRTREGKLSTGGGGGDVTLSQYSSGQNLKDTWMFYYFTFMCKSLQIFGWRTAPFCAPWNTVWCVYSQDQTSIPKWQRKPDKERPLRDTNRCLLWKKSGLKARRKL